MNNNTEINFISNTKIIKITPSVLDVILIETFEGFYKTTYSFTINSLGINGNFKKI